MLMKKFQALAQVVGCVTIGLLAVYGLLTLASGGPALASVSAALGAASGQASAVIPSTFNYQGLLRDPDGSLTTGSYTVTARIYAVAAAGSALYTETFPSVTVRDGLFNVVLGDDPQGQDLQSAFNATPRYIGISLNDQPELIPRQRLHAVPWALTAKTLVSNAIVDGITSTNDIVVSTGDVVVQSGNIRTSNLNVSNAITIKDQAPIIIKRFEDLADSEIRDTGISSLDYYCVATGWSTYYDIAEAGSHDNYVWTYVVSPTWQVRVQFASENDHEQPDVDVVCFRQQIAEWQGAAITLYEPD